MEVQKTENKGCKRVMLTNKHWERCSISGVATSGNYTEKEKQKMMVHVPYRARARGRGVVSRAEPDPEYNRRMRRVVQKLRMRNPPANRAPLKDECTAQQRRLDTVT